MSRSKPSCASSRSFTIGSVANHPSLVLQANEAGAGLVLFAKRPENSKRRLVPELGAKTTELAVRLFDCAKEDLSAWHGPCWIAAASAEDGDWIAARSPGFDVILQPPGNLGQRLMSVDARLRAEGAAQLLYIGLDCPALTPTYLQQAETKLQSSDVVLGAATDGGVCVMGARVEWPDIEDLPWSDPALGWALNERCLAHSLSTVHLPALDDIDTLAELRRLGATLSNDDRPARRSLVAWLTAAGLNG